MADQYQHDPNAKVDYSVDWASWLGSGETISTSSWTVPADLTKFNESTTTTKATAWISGGVAGKVYQIVNHIITNQVREDDRTITLVCAER